MKIHYNKRTHVRILCHQNKQGIWSSVEMSDDNNRCSLWADVSNPDDSQC